MQAAATAAPARRSTAVTDLSPPGATAPPDRAQDPVLVSQLQARFDALALEEGQGQDEVTLEEQNVGGNEGGGAVGSLLDHHPTLLVLDGELQTMPWESLPSLKHLRYHILSFLAFASAG